MEHLKGQGMEVSERNLPAIRLTDEHVELWESEIDEITRQTKRHQSSDAGEVRKWRFSANDVWALICVVGQSAFVLLFFASVGVNLITCYHVMVFSLASVSFAYCIGSVARRGCRESEFKAFAERAYRDGNLDGFVRWLAWQTNECQMKRIYLIKTSLSAFAWAAVTLGQGRFISGQEISLTASLCYLIAACFCAALAWMKLRENTSLKPVGVQVVTSEGCPSFANIDVPPANAKKATEKTG